ARARPSRTAALVRAPIVCRHPRAPTRGIVGDVFPGRLRGVFAAGFAVSPQTSPRRDRGRRDRLARERLCNRLQAMEASMRVGIIGTENSHVDHCVTYLNVEQRQGADTKVVA